MSEEEAIAILENLKIQGKTFFSQRLALDLAIKAIRIVKSIDLSFGQDSNLMIDIEDWGDIKAIIEIRFKDELGGRQ